LDLAQLALDPKLRLMRNLRQLILRQKLKTTIEEFYLSLLKFEEKSREIMLRKKTRRVLQVETKSTFKCDKNYKALSNFPH
jgi:hypothetical protein